MGEYADLIVDGSICQMCGTPFEHAAGYPQTCRECGSWNPQQIKAERRQLAAEQFDAAQRLADLHGLVLRRCTESHYQLSLHNGWLQNIYPGNCRLYWDRQHEKPPWLHLPDNWSLLDVVRAAVEEIKKGSPCQFRNPAATAANP